MRTAATPRGGERRRRPARRRGAPSLSRDTWCSRDGHELAVREVHEAEDREHHRQAERQEGVGRPQAEGVDELLTELLEGDGESLGDLDPEVGPLDVADARGSSPRRPRPRPTARQNVRAVRNLQREVDVLLDEQDRRATSPQPHQEVEDLLDDRRARPSEGSSSRSRLGEDRRARAIASFCCSPPDKVPAS